LLSRIIAIAQRTARQTIGVQITYRAIREGVETQIPIKRAGVGKTEREVEGKDGFHTRDESRDYLIEAGVLEIDGNLVDPEPHDLIDEEILGKTFTYEVLPIGKEPCWRYSDPLRTQLRVHTKLMVAT
jgi:hypothetical protein